MKPCTVYIPTNFPTEFESILYNKDDATEHSISLRPLQDFSKQKAIQKLERALAENPKIFPRDYEQQIALSKYLIKQNDMTSEIDLNPFCSSFFNDGNDLGVSVWIC